MTPVTTARIAASGHTFAEAVEAAITSHRRRMLGNATHVYVNPEEPDRVLWVCGVEIVPDPAVPLGEYWAGRAASV